MSGNPQFARPPCLACAGEQFERATEASFHDDRQDESCAGWQQLLELIDHAARRRIEAFAPGKLIDAEDWQQVVTLPAEIGRLTTVRHLELYGSKLVRLPAEIGMMSSLEEFTPYTSRRLHWLPYEITRCQRLKRSTISTRHLYGNYKTRAPFWRQRQAPNAAFRVMS